MDSSTQTLFDAKYTHTQTHILLRSITQVAKMGAPQRPLEASSHDCKIQVDIFLGRIDWQVKPQGKCACWKDKGILQQRRRRAGTGSKWVTVEMVSTYWHIGHESLSSQMIQYINQNDIYNMDVKHSLSIRGTFFHTFSHCSRILPQLMIWPKGKHLSCIVLSIGKVKVLVRAASSSTR